MKWNSRQIDSSMHFAVQFCQIVLMKRYICNFYAVLDFSWIDFICSLRPHLDLKVLGHWLHSYVLFSCVDLWWYLTPSLLANSLKQILHLKGFKSSWWVLKCTAKYCPVVKDFSQTSHVYNWFFSWIDATWCVKCQDEPKALLHCWHWMFFTFSWTL